MDPFMNSPATGAPMQEDQPDMPLGLGMALAQNTSAMSRFGALSTEEKKRMIGYIQASQTGDEAKYRIDQTVQALKENNRDSGVFW